MNPLRILALAAGIVLAPLAALGEDERRALLVEANGIRIEDGHAISAGPNAATGAAYMRITNAAAAPDRLVAVESPGARRVELHAHILEDGVARMREIDGGIEIGPGETVALERGGRHVMLMGLTAPLQPGSATALTLVFERAGRIEVTLVANPASEATGHAGH